MSVGTTPGVVAALIDAGADLEARDANGWTPLHYAAQINGTHIASLLSAGADPNVQGKLGASPLHLAAQSSKFQAWRGVDPNALIEQLLVAGADPKARMSTGELPWDLFEDDSPLKDTPNYWRLNDARFE